MAAKFLIVCASALFLQSISAQCIGAYPTLAATPLVAPLAAPCGSGIGYAEGIGYGGWGIAPAASLAASHGPGLAVATASPMPPVGVSVASENAIEGALAVAGAVPFLGTVGLEGVLPTAGAGNVAYNCGTGAVGITAEDIAAAPLGLTSPLGLAGPLGIAGPLGYDGFGYETGFGYPGAYGYGPCGYGARY